MHARQPHALLAMTSTLLLSTACESALSQKLEAAGDRAREAADVSWLEPDQPPQLQITSGTTAPPTQSYLLEMSADDDRQISTIVIQLHDRCLIDCDPAQTLQQEHRIARPKDTHQRVELELESATTTIKVRATDSSGQHADQTIIIHKAQ